MSQPKVFEFAKEVDLAPLALMAKIRDWGMPIKSHMAELTADQVIEIKKHLGLLNAKTEEPKKVAKPKVKKAATESASSKKKSSSDNSVVIVKSGKSKASVEEAEKTSKEALAGSLAAGGATGGTHSKILRKKKVFESADSEADVNSSAELGFEDQAPFHNEEPELTTHKEANLNIQTLNSEVALANPVTTEITEKSKEVVQEKSQEAKSDLQGNDNLSDTKAHIQSQSATEVTDESLRPQDRSVAVSASEAPVGQQTVAVTGDAQSSSLPVPPPIARRKEVTIGQSGISSSQSAAASQVKRNIVGRMDLSRVQGMGPGSQGGGGGGYRPQSGGYRPGGISTMNTGGATGPGMASGAGAQGGFKGKTNLRAGFVSMPSMDASMPSSSFEQEENRQREERRREKEKVKEAAAAREQGDQPPEFDPSEFKKRELVFQPKKKSNVMARPALKTQVTQSAAHKRVLKIEGAMKLVDVANGMSLKVSDITKVLIKNGVMATPQTALDFDTLALILPEFGWEAQNIAKTPEEHIDETAFGDLTAPSVTRAPVVTIMGHVDHGKTSLLDVIRKANVAAKEAGGITQHIGAYQVQLEDGYRITFLDTPGHEAFTAMRARGANVTDIAIIVVAADDGMMPQTAEAISHAKAAGVPIIVAVNKMDKPGANPDKVMQQLTELQIVPEEWGGDTIYAKVSALTKQGIPELLEQIKLLAEMSEIKANPKRSATGLVIEAKLEKGRGPVATLLVKDGTIELGQWIVAGSQKGRVRSLMDSYGQKITQAGPGVPVELLGLDGTPNPGDRFDVVRDEGVVEKVISLRKQIIEGQRSSAKKTTLEEIFAKVKAGDVKELTLVLKADVHGSLEALQGMLSKLGNEEVKLKVVHAAVGGVTESDVLLASTAKGIVIGFNVRPDTKAAQLAKNNNVDIRSYSIVYELIDDLKKALVGMLAPTIVENVLGRAEVRNTFTVPKVGTIAGCLVQDGKVTRGALVRLLREGKIIFDGKLSSLKRFKDDAREVASGYECGMGIENYNDIKVGDVIEAYIKEEIARNLDSPAITSSASASP